MANQPGPGSPEGARRNAEQIVAEHTRYHRGERRAPLREGTRTIDPNSLPGMPDPAGPHYSEAEFDPAKQAQRKG